MSIYLTHFSTKEILIGFALLLCAILFLEPTISFLRHVRAFVREFGKAGNRGPNFNWMGLIGLAWASWRACYTSPWERWKNRHNG